MNLKVILSGGLGRSQMNALAAALTAAGYDVDAGPPFDGYETLALRLVECPAERVAVLGHSFAGIPVLHAVAVDPRIIFFAEIDPVSCEVGVGSYPLAPDPPPFIWYRREAVGIEVFFATEVPLAIENAGAPRLWPGGHNALPNDPMLIQELITALDTAARPFR